MAEIYKLKLSYRSASALADDPYIDLPDFPDERPFIVCFDKPPVAGYSNGLELEFGASSLSSKQQKMQTTLVTLFNNNKDSIPNGLASSYSALAENKIPSFDFKYSWRALNLKEEEKAKLCEEPEDENFKDEEQPTGFPQFPTVDPDASDDPGPDPMPIPSDAEDDDILKVRIYNDYSQEIRNLTKTQKDDKNNTFIEYSVPINYKTFTNKNPKAKEGLASWIASELARKIYKIPFNSWSLDEEKPGSILIENPAFKNKKTKFILTVNYASYIVGQLKDSSIEEFWSEEKDKDLIREHYIYLYHYFDKIEFIVAQANQQQKQNPIQRGNTLFYLDFPVGASMDVAVENIVDALSSNSRIFEKKNILELDIEKLFYTEDEQKKYEKLYFHAPPTDNIFSKIKSVLAQSKPDEYSGHLLPINAYNDQTIVPFLEKCPPGKDKCPKKDIVMNQLGVYTKPIALKFKLLNEKIKSPNLIKDYFNIELIR
jgi:hypothetical protein